MSNQTVAAMTIEELQTLVIRIVEDRLSRIRPWPAQPSERSTAEILEAMRRDIIKPAPGEPSALEMLFEERDRWYTSG